MKRNNTQTTAQLTLYVLSFHAKFSYFSIFS